MDLEQKAIERLKLGSQVSLAHYQKPLLLTYSGGKDSDVCLELAQRAGIPFEVCHSLTTADAPQTIQHVKKKFAMLEAAGIHCKIIYPTHKGKRTSMWRLIEEKLIPPTRTVRYCCAVLKETAGDHRAIITGVRWDESNSRSNRGEFDVVGAKKARVSVMPEQEHKQLYLSDELYLNNDNDSRRKWMENCMKQRKTTCNPIIDWPNHVLWDYIRSEHIEINPLYQCGFHRVGCIGCPMAGNRRYFEFQQFPKYEIMYKHAFTRILERRKAGPDDEAIWATNGWKTADDVWNWWMEDKNLDGQVTLEEI